MAIPGQPLDGDALFFARGLVVEGDTEAVLTLRNAIDGAGIELVEILASALGPLAGVARRVLGPADALLRRATRDLERLQGALLSPVARRCDAQAAELDEIRARVDELHRRTRRATVVTGGRAGAAALEAAVDAGADAVYLGFRDQTNARNFPGLNFDDAEFRAGLGYAHGRGCKVFVAVNTFPVAGRPEAWHRAVDRAAEAGADALILADIGLLDYASQKHPELRRHLSVQASASNPEAIRFYHEAFGIKRVVLPRVLTLDAIAELNRQVPVETEVFAFGGLCVMAEGRCLLSAHATGQSPNTNGVCSPASHVRYEQRGDTLVSRLGEFTINRFRPGAPAGYPTLCKGRFVSAGCAGYLFEEPTSLNAIDILPSLTGAGVTALKIEGRQRGRAYVGRIVAAFRRAVEAAARGERLPPSELAALTEGGRNTLGAYRKAWQ